MKTEIKSMNENRIMRSAVVFDACDFNPSQVFSYFWLFKNSVVELPYLYISAADYLLLLCVAEYGRAWLGVRGVKCSRAVKIK